MDEQTAPQQTAAPEAQAAPAIDNAALLSRMDELAGEIKGLREAPSTEYTGGIADALNPQQQAADVEPAYDDSSAAFDPYGQPDQYDPYAQPDPQVAQQQAIAQLEQFVTERAQGIAHKEVSQVQQQMQQFIQAQEVQRLEKTYPDLNKPEVVGPLVEEARRFAQQLGQPELATSPAMIEKLYLAQQASARAAQETPADGDQEVHLEGGGAGQPAQPSEADDLVSRVVNAGTADAGARAFWGA